MGAEKRFLKECRLFSGLSADELETLGAGTSSLRYGAEDIIVRENDTPTALYLIVSGRVKVFMNSVSGKEFIIDVRYPGDTFYEIAMLDGQPSFATCQALEDTEVLSIRREDLLQLISTRPEIAAKIIRIAAGRIRNSYNQVISLAADSVERRLVKVLLLLSAKQGTTLSFNRREIAEMAGTTVETATRILTQLKSYDAIRSTRGKITILDRDKLASLNG